MHHGNGTQALVERDPSIRFVSMHQYPWYPGTGAADERGVGNVFNIPRPGGLPRAVYARDFLGGVDAALTGWQPDILLISAGFDSLAGDPLGEFTLEPEDIAIWSTALRARMGSRPIVGVMTPTIGRERAVSGSQPRRSRMVALAMPPPSHMVWSP